MPLTADDPRNGAPLPLTADDRRYDAPSTQYQSRYDDEQPLLPFPFILGR